MHQWLTQRATHLRPPASPTASASRAVVLERADYTSVGTLVPVFVAPKSGTVRAMNHGDETSANFAGFAGQALDIRERDVLIVDNVAYEVTFIGNRGRYLRTFDLTRRDRL